MAGPTGRYRDGVPLTTPSAGVRDRPTSSRPRRARAVVPVVAVVLLLASCTSAVPVQVAPHATDPLCAEVVLALPDDLGDALTALDTTAQATKAWGSASAPVVLRCGVEPLGPTTDRCVTVETPGGPSVDWVVVPGAPDTMSGATSGAAAEAASGATGSPTADGTAAPGGETTPADTDWTFTTYGREPAVEVHVPAEVAGARSTSFMDLLGPAVARTTQVRSCL